MCFGNSQTTSTTTPTANPAVAAAANQNLTAAEGVQNAGFTPYTGQQVANFSPEQQQSFEMTDAIAGNGTAPTASGLINNFANAPASSVNANTISSAMSPYMNQYVMQSLAPQLQQMDAANAATNQATDAQATGSGAYGDARTGIQQAQNSENQNVAREGLIGNAYNSAFNTAIGAGAQDVSNNLTAQTTNASLSEQQLGREATGATDLENLQNQQLGVAGAVNTAGQQQTAQSQANLTAQYNQWLMAQQYPFQTSQLMDSAESAGAQALPASTVSTNQTPNNSGWALAGALGGAALAPFTGGASLLAAGAAIPGALGPTSVGGSTGPTPLTYSDVRLKRNIKHVGALKDGTKVYTYRYVDDPENMTRLGLMAQEVEQRTPGAVHELYPGGPKLVDLDKATERARLLDIAI